MRILDLFSSQLLLYKSTKFLSKFCRLLQGHAFPLLMLYYTYNRAVLILKRSLFLLQHIHFNISRISSALFSVPQELSITSS